MFFFLHNCFLLLMIFSNTYHIKYVIIIVFVFNILEILELLPLQGTKYDMNFVTAEQSWAVTATAGLEYA